MKAIFSFAVRGTMMVGYFFAAMIVAMGILTWNDADPFTSILWSSVAGVIGAAAAYFRKS